MPSDDPQQTTERDRGDPVVEAHNRSVFEDRTAVGAYGNRDLIIKATRSEYGIPQLCVWASGDIIRYEEDDDLPKWEYSNGEYYTVEYDRIHALTQQFDRLVERHELEEKDV
jgi:hypothetical protein